MKVYKYPDNVDTDVIIPARYLNTFDDASMAEHCMEDIDANKVATGKAIINVRLGGIAPVRVGAANIPKGARLTSNASGQVVVQATAGGPVLGVPLETGGAVGTLSEMYLTPGATL